MDLRRGVNWMEIRDLPENAAENAAWKEERFIRKQKHIDSLIEKNNLHKMKERVLREIKRHDLTTPLIRGPEIRDESF